MSPLHCRFCSKLFKKRDHARSSLIYFWRTFHKVTSCRSTNENNHTRGRIENTLLPAPLPPPDQRERVKHIRETRLLTRITVSPSHQHRHRPHWNFAYERDNKLKGETGTGGGQGTEKHTAHSDTMLLREKRKRGRAGGTAE